MKRFNKKLLSPALMLTLMPAMFEFGPDGVTWFWHGNEVVPSLLLVSAAVFWMLFFAPARKHS